MKENIHFLNENLKQWPKNSYRPIQISILASIVEEEATYAEDINHRRYT
jgi:cell division protein YceG involved in septum cleavage